MRLLVIRHGECLANARGIVAGSLDDSLLTDKGVGDAKRAAYLLLGFRGLFVSSPLQRALKTAEIIRDIVEPGTSIRIDPSFIERNAGSMTGKSRSSYVDAEKSGIPIVGAEQPKRMANRIKAGITKLKASGQDTILVAHNGVYQMMYCLLNDVDPSEFATIPGLQNGEIHEFVL